MIRYHSKNKQTVIWKKGWTIRSSTQKGKEDTDKLAVEIFRHLLEVKVSHVDISRIHRIGKPRNQGQNPRPLIVKFTGYNVRINAFLSNKKCKAATASLTTNEMKLLRKAKKQHGSKMFG